MIASKLLKVFCINLTLHQTGQHSKLLIYNFCTELIVNTNVADRWIREAGARWGLMVR